MARCYYIHCTNGVVIQGQLKTPMNLRALYNRNGYNTGLVYT